MPVLLREDLAHTVTLCLSTQSSPKAWDFVEKGLYLAKKISAKPTTSDKPTPVIDLYLTSVGVRQRSELTRR